MHFDEKSMFAGDKKGAKSLKVTGGIVEAICCIFILFIQTFLVVQHFDVSLIRSPLIEDLWTA